MIENGMKKTDLARDYKQKLKEVVEDYVPNAVFVKSKHKNNPEQIMTKDIQDEDMGSLFVTDRLKKTLKQCGKGEKIRQDLLKLD